MGTTPAFSTIVDEVTVDQTTYTASNKTYPEGTSVLAHPGRSTARDNGLSWSDAMPFIKESTSARESRADLPARGRPALGDPTDPVRVEAAGFAASYDSRSTRTPTDRVRHEPGPVRVNVKQVAYT